MGVIFKILSNKTRMNNPAIMATDVDEMSIDEKISLKLMMILLNMGSKTNSKLSGNIVM